MKTSLANLVSLIVFIALYACNQNSNTNQQSIPSTPVSTQSYGGTLTASDNINSTSTNCSYVAVFKDGNGLLMPAGQVKANNLVVTGPSSTNQYTLYQSGQTAPNIVTWSVSGQGEVPAFTAYSDPKPSVPSFIPDTVKMGQDWVLSHSVISADSIQYQMGGGYSVIKIKTDSSSSIAFTAAEIGTINFQGLNYTTISIKAWNTKKVTVGSKYYNIAIKSTYIAQAQIK